MVKTAGVAPATMRYFETKFGFLLKRKNKTETKKSKRGKTLKFNTFFHAPFIATFQQDKFVLNLIGFWRYRRITFVGVCFDFNWFFSSLFGLCVSDAAICIGVNSFALGFI